MSASFVSCIASAKFESLDNNNKSQEQPRQKNPKDFASNVYAPSNGVDKYSRHPYFKL